MSDLYCGLVEDLCYKFGVSKFAGVNMAFGLHFLPFSSVSFSLFPVNSLPQFNFYRIPCYNFKEDRRMLYSLF
jgi:hypothetical protein